MKQVIIENSVQKSPFEEPKQFFRFKSLSEPYNKPKRALPAKIDESAWNALYTNESIPFEKPSNKDKIAVNGINHYGNEALKVYEV